MATMPIACRAAMHQHHSHVASNRVGLVMGETTATVGIPWYRRRDYAEILSIMADGRHLPPSYDRWRLRAEDLERRVRANGRQTVRAVIEPRAFRRWCVANRQRTDGPARLAFIEESLRRTGESRGG